MPGSNVGLVRRQEVSPFVEEEGLFYDPFWGTAQRKRFEISNLELIKDMKILMKLPDVLSEQSVSITPRI